MILFACNDAGPSQYIKVLIDNLLSASYYWASPVSSSILSRSKAIKFNPCKDWDAISLVVTGASIVDGSDSVDKQSIIKAKDYSIPCVSVVEHWSWYRQRFMIDNKLILPDYIIVNDHIALEDSLKEGLPHEKLRALGNPYLEKLCEKPSLKAPTKALKRKHLLPSAKRIITFISEELNSIPDITGSDLDYNEFEVLKQIQNTLSKNDHLFVKLHPEEDMDKYKQFVSSSLTVLKEVSPQDIATFSDKIIFSRSKFELMLLTPPPA